MLLFSCALLVVSQVAALFWFGMQIQDLKQKLVFSDKRVFRFLSDFYSNTQKSLNAHLSIINDKSDHIKSQLVIIPSMAAEVKSFENRNFEFKEILEKNKLISSTINSTFSEFGLKISGLEKKLDSVLRDKTSELESSYVELINNASPEMTFLTIQHCFNRLPGSFVLLKKLWEHIDARLNSENIDPIIQRQLVQVMDDAIEFFEAKCNIKMVYLAEPLRYALNERSEKILKSLADLEKRRFDSAINLVSQKLHMLKNADAKDKDKVIEDLQKIDATIDRDRLEKYPEINSKYSSLSEQLVDYFNTTKSTEEDIATKNYNKRCIDSHQKAYDLFDANTGLFEENDYKNGKKLDNLVALMAGWDNRILLPATIVYTSMIYGSIFSKMKNKAQLRMTESMIKAPIRPLN